MAPGIILPFPFEGLNILVNVSTATFQTNLFVSGFINVNSVFNFRQHYLEQKSFLNRGFNEVELETELCAIILATNEHRGHKQTNES